MIRYLKYIFLIFGGLALAVIGFFVFQNKKDLGLVWEYWDRLDYDSISENCPEAKNNYYYPCFKEEFKSFVEEGSLTAIGLGLKLAFNFMDEDKAGTTKFANQEQKDIAYALNYLELNNIAISQSHKRFYGFQNMYGGYLSSLRDYLDGAKKFSDNLIQGLESEEGIAALEDPEARERFAKRFKKIKDKYQEVYSKARGFVESEIEAFLKKAEARE